jgi:hypothetical protein
MRAQSTRHAERSNAFFDDNDERQQHAASRRVLAMLNKSTQWQLVAL